MRTEAQIRERLEALTPRLDRAVMDLVRYVSNGEWTEAERLMADMSDLRVLQRALVWALGGSA